jgi:hypothetical protein
VPVGDVSLLALPDFSIVSVIPHFSKNRERSSENGRTV